MKAVVVQLAESVEGKLLVGDNKASPLHLEEPLLIGCGVREWRKRYPAWFAVPDGTEACGVLSR